jgi:hypothetical protein
VNDTLPVANLCIADDATFWPWFTWPDFATWPDKEHTLVVLPVAGLEDCGLDQPLDAEETVLMSVLKEASLRRRPGLRLLVVPPVRFVLGPSPTCAFPVDPDVACNLLEELAASIGAAGFTKITFFNASPWTEELCKAVGRDLRIARKLQMFCVHLSALGLDFNPVRGGDRAKLKAVLAALTGDPAGAAAVEGGKILTDTALRLAAIFGEMSDRAPLPNGGEILPVSWPL